MTAKRGERISRPPRRGLQLAGRSGERSRRARANVLDGRALGRDHRLLVVMDDNIRTDVAWARTGLVSSEGLGPSAVFHPCHCTTGHFDVFRYSPYRVALVQ